MEVENGNKLFLQTEDGLLAVYLEREDEKPRTSRKATQTQ